MIRTFAALFAAAALSAACSAQAQTSDAAEPGKLYVSAIGEVVRAPDVAIVNASVIANGRTAKDAMAEQREAMNDVVAALKRAGVKERDIQTSSFQLYPNYVYDQSRQEQRLTGYRASNSVQVTLRDDIDDAGATLDALVEAGINDIGGVSFGISDREAAEDEARKLAIEKVKARAQTYAEAGDINLGRILEMREQTFRPYGGPEAIVVTAARADSAPTPISGGEFAVSVTVNAVYEIR